MRNWDLRQQSISSTHSAALISYYLASGIWFWLGVIHQPEFTVHLLRYIYIINYRFLFISFNFFVASILQLMKTFSNSRPYYVFYKSLSLWCILGMLPASCIGAFICWAEADISWYEKLLSLFIVLWHYAIGSGWRGLLWPQTIWNLNMYADIQVRPALLSPGERLSLSFCVRFCPVISFTNCIHWVHEICSFSVKSKPQSGRNNPYFWGRE